MGDEEQRRVAFALQVGHELEDLRLNGHVQGRGGLVGDEQVRLAGQRHGDHHPLTLTARKAVRIFVQPSLGLWHLYQFEQLHGPVARRFAHQAQMQLERLHQLLAYGEHRVQARHGLLKDHGDARTAHFLQRLLLGFQERDFRPAAGAQRDGAVGVHGGIRQQAQDGEPGDALAGAGFPHQADRLARADLEGDVAHRVGGLAP